MEERTSDAVEWGPAPQESFTGRAWFGPLVDRGNEINVLAVAFEPGARTNWHSHPGGQVLYCVSGIGLVANDRGERTPLTPGGAVQIPPGELHWHGASPESPMTHLSITAGGETVWADDPVTDEQYSGA